MAKGFNDQPPQNQDFWDIAEQASILSDGEIATGIARHPVTKRWQTWVSLYGTDITCCTAHNHAADAKKVAQDIAAAWKEGKLTTPEAVTAFLRSLPSDAVSDPLPQNVLMRLGKMMKY